MSAGLQRQRRDRAGLVYGQCSIDMRKEIAPTRGLPFQLRPKIFRLISHKHEIRHIGKMPGRSFSQLMGGGKMDKPVAAVSGRTMIGAAGYGLAPFGFGCDLV